MCLRDTMEKFILRITESLQASAKNSDVNTWLPDIHFINRSSAISVGDNGIILQTTDTGYN